MEQGATIIPRVRKDPLEIEAPISSAWCTTLASASTSDTLRSVSWDRVILAARVMIKWVSTPAFRRRSSARTPKITPEAPEIATMSRGAFTLQSDFGERRSTWTYDSSILNRAAT